MADYTDIRDLFSHDTLMKKVQVAAIIAARNLLSGTPSAAQKAYAAQVFDQPGEEARKLLMAVLAANSGQDLVTITGATDNNVQSQVDAVVPALVDALAGQ